MDLFSPRRTADSERTQAIKQRLAKALALEQDATVMVTELECRDTGCPDVETVIAVLRPGRLRLQVKLVGALSRMSNADLDAEIKTITARLAAQARAGESPYLVH